MSNVEIRNIRPFNSSTATRAFCEVRIGGVSIRDCKIVKVGDRPPFISMPSNKYTKKDGTEGYSNIVFVSESIKKMLDEEVGKLDMNNLKASSPESDSTVKPVAGNEIPF